MIFRPKLLEGLLGQVNSHHQYSILFLSEALVVSGNYTAMGIIPSWVAFPSTQGQGVIQAWDDAKGHVWAPGPVITGVYIGVCGQGHLRRP